MKRTFKTEIRDGIVVIAQYRNNDAIATSVHAVDSDGPIKTLIGILNRIQTDPHCINDITVTIESSEIGSGDEPAPEPSIN